MDSLKRIFDKIISEASTGTVIIDDIPYNIKFNTLNNGSFNDSFGCAVPTLVIKNKQLLLDAIKKYIEICSIVRNEKIDDIFIKKYVSFLWCNATYTDFSNPIEYVNRVIDYYQNRVDDSSYDTEIGRIDIENKIGEIQDETPYVFCSSINGEDSFSLPCITYGISNDTCYIYSVQNKKQESNNYRKVINRMLYKINSGVVDDYEPMNIKDVSVSAIASLTIFMNTILNSGISNFCIISLLPVRYNGRTVSYEKRLAFFGGDSDSANYLALKKKYEDINDIIDDNISTKLLCNFKRLNYHFPNINITSDPFEVDEYMHLEVGPFEKGDNELLNILISKNRKK